MISAKNAGRLKANCACARVVAKFAIAAQNAKERHGSAATKTFATAVQGGLKDCEIDARLLALLARSFARTAHFFAMHITVRLDFALIRSFAHSLTPKLMSTRMAEFDLRLSEASARRGSMPN